MSQDTNSTLTVVLMSKNYCYQFLPDEIDVQFTWVYCGKNTGFFQREGKALLISR